jgi:hypothetical protein
MPPVPSEFSVSKQPGPQVEYYPGRKSVGVPSGWTAGAVASANGILVINVTRHNLKIPAGLRPVRQPGPQVEYYPAKREVGIPEGWTHS